MDGPALVEICEVVRQSCYGDPGALAPTDRLAELGLVGLDLLACLGAIESRFGIELPADLVPVLETVDDLVYYTMTKLSQQ